MKAVIEIEISDNVNITEAREKLQEWVYGMVVAGKPYGVLSARLVNKGERNE